MNKLVVLSAVPGSGKSYFSLLLKEKKKDGHLYVVSSDKLRAQVGGVQTNFSNEALIWEMYYDLARVYAKDKDGIVVLDSTNAKKEFRIDKVKPLKELFDEIDLVMFKLDKVTVKVLSKTQFGEYRYQKGNVVYLYSEKLDLRLEAKVISYRHSGLFDFIKLDIINTKEEAEAYKHYEVQVEKNLNDLQEDEFFFDDLKGCQVIDLNSNVLGKVSVVEEFPAQITLRVKRPNGKEFFVPFIETFVKNVDIKAKTIQIEVIEGML